MQPGKQMNAFLKTSLKKKIKEVSHKNVMDSMATTVKSALHIWNLPHQSWKLSSEKTNTQSTKFSTKRF